MQIPSIVLVCLACHMLIVPVPVSGNELAVNGQGRNEADSKKSDTLPEGRNPVTGSRVIFFPTGHLYPPYAADPVRMSFGIQPVHVLKSAIPDTSTSRINLKAGGELPLARTQPESDPELGWEISLMGGFNDQNDVRQSLDNIGWDGHYGLLVTGVPVKGLAFKAALLHVSSHVGDELMERTGRRRIGYTRQELAAGVSWFVNRRWRVYTEAGKAVSMSNEDLQRPWRMQAGVEYETAPRLLQGFAAWYVASDWQAMQERDWRVDTSIQTGFVVRSGGRSWRLGVEWYNGRPPIGEFFQYTERYTSIGLWIDV